MNLIHLIVAELKAIVAKPHNIIVMLAVMCVPLLYAGMFLYSFWDAFGETGKLPVAVVNQDQGAKIAGKTLNAGKDLVKQLKKNDEFKWKFVSEKEAQNGFHNNKYFMTVRIPASFSKHATTLADGTVKPAQMIYRLNADYNFIASRMADAGEKELKSRISAEITKTYAQSMYKQLDELTDGLKQASAGSTKLTKGAKKELTGLNQLKNGFESLASGTATLQSGTAQLASGAQQLNSGAGTLSTGVQHYTGAVSGQLVPGAAQLTNGLNQLNSGIQSQNLVGQVNQLNNGMQAFDSIINGLPAQFNSSINPAAIGSAAAQQVAANKSAIETNALSTVQGNKNQIEQAAGQSLDAASIGEQAIAQANASANGTIADQSLQGAEGITGLVSKNVTDSESSIQNGLRYNSNGSDSSLYQALYSVYLAGAGGDSAKAAAAANAAINQIASNVTQEIAGSINSTATNKAIAAGLQQSSENTIKQTAVGTAQQVAPAAAYAAAQQIAPTTAYATAQQTAQQTASGTASQIKSGVVSGLNQKDPSTGLTLNAAAQQLAAGTSQLAGGNGLPLLASSVNQAAQGANQLNSGLNQLNSNSAALAGGAKTLAQSTGKLANGADQLTTGASALASGQDKLASGANQLSDGAEKIYQGNQTLGTNLSTAHGQLAKTPTDGAHAQQFATPVHASNQSHQSVDTFGSGFAPYFISLGLYVGALLLTIIFDLGRPSGQATSGWAIALSKFFITLLMSIGQSLLIDIIVLKGLGLHVSNPMLFVAYTILTSMSFMAIIEWLAGSFDNEGRFACIVILILQLVSSGGAYAIQLIPNWLQNVANFLPMTYSVNGFRAIIDGHQPALLSFNATVLWIFVLVAVGLSILTFTIRFNHKLHQDSLKNQVTSEI
ncbi:MAG: YhgE/Pip domain-containing protein [Sporolactobacillus sp.]